MKVQKMQVQKTISKKERAKIEAIRLENGKAIAQKIVASIDFDALARMKNTVETQLKLLIPTIQKTVDHMNTVKNLSAPRSMIYIAPQQPVTYREVEKIIEQALKKELRLRGKTEEEILFTRDKQLIRIVAGKELKCSFVKNKKRIAVLEVLVGEKNHTPTKVIQKQAECVSENALRKIVQEINHAVKIHLQIKHNLIEGRRMFGYKINEKLSLVKE